VRSVPTEIGSNACGTPIGDLSVLPDLFFSAPLRELFLSAFSAALPQIN
jgi:hypothetical protein